MPVFVKSGSRVSNFKYFSTKKAQEHGFNKGLNDLLTSAKLLLYLSSSSSDVSLLSSAAIVNLLRWVP
jgi:hypothetical protein